MPKDNSNHSVEEAKQPPPSRSFFHSRKKRILLIIAALLVIGLSVGLGVGLTIGRRNNDDSDDADSADSQHIQSAPLPSSLPSPICSGADKLACSLWKPSVGSSWQIILSRVLAVDASTTAIDPDVAVYDVDMFNTDNAVIKKLHDMGKKVICYFSAGTYESWRSDASKFSARDLGKDLPDWPGEKWVNLKSDGVRQIMMERIAIAASRGCDAIDPDNVDAYDNDNGLGMTEDDSIAFVKFLADTAAGYNMSTGLKNAGSIIEDVLGVVQFSVNEQCAEYKECETYAPFVKAGKPVFHIEYPKGAPSVSRENRDRLCSKGDGQDGAGSDGFSTVLKKMELDGWVEFCDGKVAETKTTN